MDIAAIAPLIGLPTQFSSSTPVLQAGQIVDALVLALLENDTVRLSLPGMVLDVRSTVALTPGMTVRLAVQSSSTGLELVIIGNAAHGAAVASASSAPAGRLQPVADQTSPGATAAAGGAGGEPAAASSGQATIVEITGAHAASLAISAPDIAAAAPEIAAAAAKPLSPAEAVGQAARVAASRQGGLAPLIANVIQVLAGSAATMPRPVLQAALGVLGFRVALDENLAAGDLKQALAQSGLFLEARLAAPQSRAAGGAAGSIGPTNPGHFGSAAAAPATTTAVARSPVGDPKATSPTGDPKAVSPTGDPKAASPAGDPKAASPAGDLKAPSPAGDPKAISPAGDLKAALLVFREVVKLWVDTAGPANAAGDMPGAAVAPRLTGALASTGAGAAAKGVERTVIAEPTELTGAGPAAAPPPPYRGAPPSAQPVAAASIPDHAAPADVAQRLLAQTDGVLARHTLMQIASLPDQAHSGPRTDTQGPQWLFEIPFATRQGTSVAQFEISRDGHAVDTEGRVIWRARFSLDVEPMGPVHAQVSVLGERAAVTLWAERDTTAARLRASTAMLSEALRKAELEPGDIQCRAGAPVAPRPAAGRFLDQAS